MPTTETPQVVLTFERPTETGQVVWIAVARLEWLNRALTLRATARDPRTALRRLAARCLSHALYIEADDFAATHGVLWEATEARKAQAKAERMADAMITNIPEQEDAA